MKASSKFVHVVEFKPFNANWEDARSIVFSNRKAADKTVEMLEMEGYVAYTHTTPMEKEYDKWILRYAEAAFKR